MLKAAAEAALRQQQEAQSAVAEYHLSYQSLSRRAGRSAVSAAAYRAGQDLLDERTGERHNFSHRTGVVESWVQVPEGTHPIGRELLWSTAELTEKRVNSRTASEVQCSLPHELNSTQRKWLTLKFAKWISDEYQVAVDVAIHTPGRGDERNHHFHMLLTTRQYQMDGSLGRKSSLEISDSEARERGLMDMRKRMKFLRERWADFANSALEEAGFDERVDHRSLQEQGIKNRVPTQHLGPAAAAAKRKGQLTEIEAVNQVIKQHNQEVDEMNSIMWTSEKEEPEIEIVKFDKDKKPDLDKYGKPKKKKPAVTFSDANVKKQMKSAADFKYQLLQKTYGTKVAQVLGPQLKFIKLPEGDGPVILTFNNGGKVADHGFKLTAKEGTLEEIHAMDKLARARDWENIMVYGTDEFVSTSAEEMAVLGWDIRARDPAQQSLVAAAVARGRARRENTSITNKIEPGSTAPASTTVNPVPSANNPQPIPPPRVPSGRSFDTAPRRLFAPGDQHVQPAPAPAAAGAHAAAAPAPVPGGLPTAPGA